MLPGVIVVPRVGVDKHNQDASLMTICGKRDEVVQIFEVIRVARQHGPPISNGVG